MKKSNVKFVVSNGSARITPLDFSCESFVKFLFRTISSVSGFMKKRKKCLKRFVSSSMYSLSQFPPDGEDEEHADDARAMHSVKHSTEGIFHY